jgi:hypothetical protein
MFDDQEENQDQPMSLPARLRFAYRLAGLDPDSDRELGGNPSRATQTSMTPGTPLVDGARSRPALQGEPQVSQRPGIGQRIMQMDLDAASGQREAGMAPKLGLGERMVAVDGRQLVRRSSPITFDNPQARLRLGYRFAHSGMDPQSDQEIADNPMGGINSNHRRSPQVPLARAYVAGPSPQAGDNVRWAAGYLKWRGQNFRPATGGGWEAPSGRLYTNKDLLELYSAQQREAEWAQRRREQEQHASAVAKGNAVTITYGDGMKETRQGNHPQRDNNPGNVEYGDFARKHGVVGRDGGFAIFPSAEVGWAALDALLRSDYQAMTIDEAIRTYAPRKNRSGQVINDTAKYQASVRAALGVPGGTKISSLTPEQFEILKQTIAQIEGFNEKRPKKKAKVIRELPTRPNVIQRN